MADKDSWWQDTTTGNEDKSNPFTPGDTTNSNNNEERTILEDLHTNQTSRESLKEWIKK